MSSETMGDAGTRQQVYLFQGFSLDVKARKLTTPEGKALPLSSRAFDTLAVLVEHQGETLSKDFLLQTVWPSVIVEENNLNQAISSLRRALGDSKQEPNFIQTVSGRGYCFIAPLDIQGPATTSTPLPETDTPPPPEAEQEQTPQPATAPLPRSGAWPLYAAGGVLGLLLVTLFFFSSFMGQDDADRGMDSEPQSPEILPNSVAVLPFSNLNPPTDDGLFAMGLHDELISQLAKVQSLQVISRENVMGLNDTEIPLEEFGRLLKVESVLTGSIMYLDDTARVSLQMLDPATGVTLWASSYEAGTRDIAELLPIQSDIAVNVAQALHAEINQQDHQALNTLPTSSFEAYRYYLAARNAYYAQDFAKTWTLSNQAIELDSDYIDAHYLFSYVNTVMTAVPLTGMSRRDHFLRAMESAEKIIALAPESSTGYILRAGALGTIGDWEAVGREVDRLRGLGVPLAELKFYAPALLSLGDFDTAVEILEANLLTEPVNLYGRGFLLAAYELKGEREQARREYRIGEELNPIWWGDTVNLFLGLGRRESLEGLDNILISEALKDLLRNLDDEERVMGELLAFSRRENPMSAESVYYGAIAAYIGEHDMAVNLMRDALDGVWLGFYWLWLPVFDETRKTQAFRDLLMESGIVDYWQAHGWPEVCQPAGESVQCNWQAYPQRYN